jgi:alkylation response protein AidB-like acyl-CoA dehydrogenase
VSPELGLDEDQREFYRLARTFADKEMRPFASEWDLSSSFPKETFSKFADLGFAAISVSDELGGSGLSRVDNVIIVEGLATGCVGTTAMLTIHNMCAGMIDRFGTGDQREEWLPKLASLDVMASYCLTEPSSGSDAASLLSTAKLSSDGKSYVLNGGKAFISGAGLSDIYLVMCRTGEGISCLMVPKDTPGLSFGADEKKMGWKVQPTRQVIFEDVVVPVTNRLGAEGQGFKMAMTGLDGGRLSIGACSLGAAQASFEIALDYAKERKQFGKSIADNQATQFKLADMAGNITMARLSLRHAAALLDAKSPAATVHCALAKKNSTDLCFQVCNDALQLLGGYGYLHDYEIERYLRDVRVHQILEGTNEIMRHISGRALVA